MQTVAALLDAAVAQLGESLGVSPREARTDARVLCAHSWGKSPAWLIAHDHDPVADDAACAFLDLIAARATGQPVAYLVGYREFYGRRFAVSPNVLIPRPDTELLVDAALARLPELTPAYVLDLGTGSGCIAISLALERPLAVVDAVDMSSNALETARANAAALGAAVRFIESDWFAALDSERYDCIVSNPPYIAPDDAHLARGDVRFEPVSALVAAETGLCDLRTIACDALPRLKPGGWLLMEHGYNQGERVAGLVAAAGYHDVATLYDLAGLARISVGRKA